MADTQDDRRQDDKHRDAAQRALSEAAERRAAYEKAEAELARKREVDGRGGRDPVRYGDWERKGLASDF